MFRAALKTATTTRTLRYQCNVMLEGVTMHVARDPLTTLCKTKVVDYISSFNCSNNDMVSLLYLRGH